MKNVQLKFSYITAITQKRIKKNWRIYSGYVIIEYQFLKVCENFIAHKGFFFIFVVASGYGTNVLFERSNKYPGGSYTHKGSFLIILNLMELFCHHKVD